MIKRISFVTRRSDVSREAFALAWPRAVACTTDAPPDVRPSRVAVCTTLPELTGPQPKHDGIGVEWFADAGHLERFGSWLEIPDGRSVLGPIRQVVDRDASPVVVADESVLRGADWLEQRWRDGGEKLKHMAIAVRATNLTAAEFSERWTARAGLIRRPGKAEVTVIPDEARGRAYVQNHPRPRATGDWAYDALNEVYFDDVESLRRRIEWFRQHLLDGIEEDLVRQSWFIAAREEVVVA